MSKKTTDLPTLHRILDKALENNYISKKRFDILKAQPYYELWNNIRRKNFVGNKAGRVIFKKLTPAQFADQLKQRGRHASKEVKESKKLKLGLKSRLILIRSRFDLGEVSAKNLSDAERVYFDTFDAQSVKELEKAKDFLYDENKFGTSKEKMTPERARSLGIDVDDSKFYSDNDYKKGILTQIHNEESKVYYYDRGKDQRQANKEAKRDLRPTGALGQQEADLYETYPRTPRQEIVNIKASELARPHTGSRNRIPVKYYEQAVDWFDSLDNKTRVDLEGRFARRRESIDKRLIAFLKRKNVSPKDIDDFLKSNINYHHFDEVILGTESSDKFFSGAHIDRQLHRVLHDNLMQRYASELSPSGISRSARLQQLLKASDPTRRDRFPKPGLIHHTGEIQNYDPLRKGTIPPYLRIIAENTFGADAAKEMLEEALYIAKGTGTPSHLKGKRTPKDFTPSNFMKLMIGRGFSTGPLLPISLTAAAGGTAAQFYPEDLPASDIVRGGGQLAVALSDPAGAFVTGGWDKGEARIAKAKLLENPEMDRRFNQQEEAQQWWGGLPKKIMGLLKPEEKKKRENIWT